MIITCPCEKKQFKIDSSLIPQEGRELQCGSCETVWFYKPKNESEATLTLNENISEKLNIKSGTEITSPIIGTAYHSPEPGAKKFVEVGKKIKKGDTIMIVEAMKTMNHVPSTADGVVKEICVEDGHPVEFGQTIIILE